MTQIPDETLMAYADGELSAEERAALEARLADDAALRARLEPFQATGSALASMFDKPLYEPVPERLIDTIAAAGNRVARPKTPARVAWKPFGWLDALNEAVRMGTPQFATAFGISALVLTAGLGGWVLGRTSDASTGLVVADQGGLVAAGALLTALETAPSAQPGAQADRGTHVMAVQTFRNRDGTYCREYNIAESSGRAFEGVACRPAENVWRIALHVETAAKATVASGAPAPGAYETAGGANSAAVESVVGDLIKGDALGADDESRAISRNWAAPSGN